MTLLKENQAKEYEERLGMWVLDTLVLQTLVIWLSANKYLWTSPS